MLSSSSWFLILLVTTKISRVCSVRNIIIIITDDQDIELGSMDFMPRTTKLLKEKGVYFKSGFVTTPICCPSRSTILSGLYVHNHNVHTNNANCSGPEWRQVHEPLALPVHLQAAGYKTAYFGKYLNEYNGSYIPPGWDHWCGLIKNSKFYNYTINFNGIKQKFGNNYDKDYFTDLVTNRSLDFMADHFQVRQWQPFLAVVSYPAPHGPEDPAPQYAHLFNESLTHRTDSWNYAPNPDKQWILQRTGKMEPVHVAFTDLLHRRRLQTLQSVDDGVQRIFSLLRDYNQLSSTYVLYTSDHGYHLGQFGLIKGKSMPYEFDIRVPFFLRGPGIPRNVTMHQPVSNADIVPTCMDIAGLPRPNILDGRSLLELFKTGKHASQLTPWRDTLLIERGKMPRLKKVRERFLKQKERFSKEMRLRAECSKSYWQQDCAEGQQWKCHQVFGRWRLQKCREVRCHCQREKRSASDADFVDEFLMDAYRKDVLTDKEWYQGNFHWKKNRRARSSCVCHTNSSHPLKNSFSDDLLALGTFERTGKKRFSSKFYNDPLCSQPQMTCFEHSSSHWRTPPLWPDEYGDFCFCQNSNNNTYWCLRTVNATHNSLYCEFVTEFISYYDLNEDPYQLTNIIYSLELPIIEELSERLRLLKSCSGKACDQFSQSNWKQYIPTNE